MLVFIDSSLLSKEFSKENLHTSTERFTQDLEGMEVSENNSNETPDLDDIRSFRSVKNVSRDKQETEENKFSQKTDNTDNTEKTEGVEEDSDELFPRTQKKKSGKKIIEESDDELFPGTPEAERENFPRDISIILNLNLFFGSWIIFF